MRRKAGSSAESAHGVYMGIAFLREPHSEYTTTCPCMFSTSLFAPIRNQLRAGSLSLHTSAVRFAWPVGKTGKLLTPYIRFTQEKRPEILAKNPDISIPETGRKLGELWRQLPESERLRYKDEYFKAKEAQK